MTKRVQIVGHTAAVALTFIGRSREVTVDTDNDNLRVHDGSTPGGEVIPNKTFVDARDTTIEGKADAAQADATTAIADAAAALTAANAAIPKSVVSAADQVIVSTGASTSVSLGMVASTILARLASGAIVAATTAEIKTLLDLVIGVDVQAQNARLAEIAALAPTDNNFIVGNGAAFAIETPSAARSSLDVVQTANIFKHAFPVGTKAIFFQAAAPTGWTQDVTQNDKVLRVVSGAGGGSAGSWTITGVTVDGHVLLVGEMPRHQHSTTAVPGTTLNAGGGAQREPFAAVSISSSFAGNDESHTHGLTSDAAWRPAYIDVIICTKDAP